jgi:hypothetical protein
MPPVILAIVAVGLLIGPAEAAQGQRVCTPEAAEEADNSLDGLNDWHRVYESFKRYAHCDDGAIAQGYSDKIAHLLADRWVSVEELFHLWRAHPRFGRFVLSHLDELMSPDQAKTIAENARRRCPPDSKKYCLSLERRAQAP